MASKIQQKKMQSMGCTVKMEDGGATLFWTAGALGIHGVSIIEAIAQMEAAQEIVAIHPDVAFHHSPDNKRLVNVSSGGRFLSDTWKTPHELLTMVKEGVEFAHRFDTGEAMPDEPVLLPEEADAPIIEEEIYDPVGEPDTFEEIVEGVATPIAPHEATSDTPLPPERVGAEPIERIGNVPVNGGIAYKEGITAADCPYSSEDEEQYADFERWNAEWDEAADAAEPEEDKVGGSVVKDKYRAIYAERGHPSHCGDWLADILNNLCIANGQTDMGRFSAICELNGVNMSKYKTSGNGWQGRYRMTGRNLLARKLFSAEFLLAPGLNGETEQFPVPQEWKDAQRFVKEAKVA